MNNTTLKVKEILVERFSSRVGQGWHGILDEFFDEILERLSSLDIDTSSVSYEDFDVKEKRGSLRVWTNFMDQIEDIVDIYEQKSTTICDVCGHAGRLAGSSNAWLSVRCDEHQLF
jgi:hypothetical protein